MAKRAGSSYLRIGVYAVAGVMTAALAWIEYKGLASHSRSLVSDLFHWGSDVGTYVIAACFEFVCVVKPWRKRLLRWMSGLTNAILTAVVGLWVLAGGVMTVITPVAVDANAAFPIALQVLMGGALVGFLLFAFRVDPHEGVEHDHSHRAVLGHALGDVASTAVFLVVMLLIKGGVTYARLDGMGAVVIGLIQVSIGAKLIFEAWKHA